jgi:hypothetical protein
VVLKSPVGSPLLYRWSKISQYFLCRSSKAGIGSQAGPDPLWIYYHQGLTVAKVDSNNQHHHIPLCDFENKHCIFLDVEIRAPT